MTLEIQAVARAMGAAGRAYVSARYDWAPVAEAMESLYEKILSAHR